MASIVIQRDLILTLKKETNLNVGILSKLQPMLLDLSKLIFKENALEKPTQTLFNHLSYYLVSIIDSQVHASLTWPLYDTKAERAYRNEFSVFISDYSSKGLLTPVMSSYLVNPGCYKVTVLMFQLSQLAVNRLLLTKMMKDNKKALYNTITQQYKAQEKAGFLECIEKETEIMLSKFPNYIYKRHTIQKIAELFRKKITKMEKKLSDVNAHSYINKLVDNFVVECDLDDKCISEILKIKNTNEQSAFFDNWLLHADNQLDSIEKEWENKVSPLLEKCKVVHDLSEAVVNRYTGQVEKSSYTLEYDPKANKICTKELQNHVNTQQTYILKNIEKDGQLNFPNLIRAFVVSICYILKNNEIGDEIYNFNEYLEGSNKNYEEMVSALRLLIERVLNSEAQLKPAPVLYRSVSIREYPEIPMLPDLSDLKTSRTQYQAKFDSLTPLNLTRYQFNLRRRTSGTFAKPEPKSMQLFNQLPKEEFLKSLKSCRANSNDHVNVSQNIHNISIISNINKVNETIAECSSGFTKQQILRLLSTKKSSSSKKFKYKTERPDIKIKKGGLFNETINLNESNGLFRSYSSPNLYDKRERQSFTKVLGKKLSIMQEDSSSQLDVSGITCFDADSNYNSPHGLGNAESSRNLDTSNIPTITVTSGNEARINSILSNVQTLNNLDMDSTVSPILEVPRKSLEITPKTNPTLIRKTSSLEKIINRFKKVRANVIIENNETEIKTIEEENFNLNFDLYTTNRNLLPDLLSPSCSVLKSVNNNYLDDLCFDDDVANRRPRESLGTALGVDQTFLDQFDLID